MTRYYMDFEFFEDGRTIEPISFGCVAEDGRELYLVNSSLNLDRFKDFPWLIHNVLPYLPVYFHDESGEWEFDSEHVDAEHLMERRHWGETIGAFMTGSVELWGYFSAYDHIALAQCFGRMIDLPSNIPMWTNDIQQFATEHGLSAMDVGPTNGSQHHALADAGWTMVTHDLLRKRVAQRDDLRKLYDDDRATVHLGL